MCAAIPSRQDVASSQNTARTRLRSCHPGRNGRKVFQDVCGLCPFGEIVPRGTQGMAAVQRRVAGTQDRFVGDVLQFDRPLLEEIDGITQRGDFDDRKTPPLHENRALEKLVVQFILPAILVERAAAQAENMSSRALWFKALLSSARADALVRKSSFDSSAFRNRDRSHGRSASSRGDHGQISRSS